MTSKDITKGIPIGAKFISGGRTISEGDFTMMHNVTWTIGRSHTDKEYMANTEFGERILAGNLILALMGGLAEVAGIYDILLPEKYGVELVALLSYEDVKFINPVLPGDTIRCNFEIIDTRATKKPNRGVIKLKNISTKNGGQIVAEATQIFLYKPSGSK